MADLSQTIAPKSDQLNADDLIGGKKLTIKITRVSKAESPDQPIAIFFEGDNGKPYKPCKSMRRVLVQIWGKDGASYVGRRMTLYRDDKVMFGGVAVGGIRISHMSGINEKITLALTASKANRKPFTVTPLFDDQETSKPLPVIDPAVKAAGDAAAANGVQAYTQWKDALAADVKETIRPLHIGWTSTAKAADMAKLKAEEEIPFDAPASEPEDDEPPAM